MELRDVERIETELGLEIPETLRAFLLSSKRVVRSKNTTIGQLLESWLLLSAGKLIRLNERLVDAGPIAGLRRWPSYFFVFGDDGLGNYYAADVRKRKDCAVVFFDHEVGEIRLMTKSFAEFLDGFRAGKEFDEVVLHSYRETASRSRRRMKWQPTRVDIGHGSEAWQTDWQAFVDKFVTIVSQARDKQDRTTRLNAAFGGRPIRWQGKVDFIELGEYPCVHVRLSVFEREVTSTRYRFSRMPLTLRTQDNITVDPTAKGQVLTTRESWEKVKKGCEIRFESMLAPGHEDLVCCMHISDAIVRGVYEVEPVGCGANLVDIVARRSPRQTTKPKSKIR